MKELDAARLAMKAIHQSDRPVSQEQAQSTALVAIAEALTGILSILNDITTRDGLLVKDGDRV